MKHMKLALVVSFLCMFTAIAQDFQGKAIYESKTSMGDDFGPPDMPEARKQEIRERMKRAMERTFELTFDRTSSIYKEEKKLDAPGSQGGVRFRFGAMAAGGGDYHKNIQEQTYTNQSEMFGKIFLIKDSLPNWEWQLGSETKKIGNYTCFKATAVKREADMMERLRQMRPRRRGGPSNENVEQKDSIQKDSANTILSQLKPPNKQEVTVWYTPEIPVSQGPGSYWGLPGLILEVNDGNTAILCSKLVLNPEEKIKIEAPSKGKQVGQKEYDELMTKKMKEMSERFGNERRRGANGPRIRS